MPLKRPLKNFSDSTILPKTFGLSRIRRDNQDERNNLRRARGAVIAIQFDSHMVVMMDGILKLDLLKLLLAYGTRIEVLARGDGGFFDKPVRHCLAKGVIINDIAERDGARAHGLRRRRQFKAKDRFQAVDGVGPGAGAVAVCLVHKQDEIVKTGQIGVVALADGLLQSLHARLAARALFLVDFIDVEDVDVNVRAEQIG